MHQIQKLKHFLFDPAVIFAQCIEARCWIENEDVVGAAPTGDAPTTSEWSIILLPNKVWLILGILRYFELTFVFSEALKGDGIAGIILWICPVNERLHYNVTPSLIGWAHTQNDPWSWNEKGAILFYCHLVSYDTHFFKCQWVLCGLIS